MSWWRLAREPSSGGSPPAWAPASSTPSSSSGCAVSRCCWSMSPAALTVSIFVINVMLHKPIIDALLFSLAIAVGITPQLLPAVVSTSLAAGSRRMARRKVLVKRLVCIEDLGDIDVLFTDKTGTLTEGQISYMRSLGADGRPADEPVRWGLVCTEAAVGNGHAVGGNPLDVALWESPAAGTISTTSPTTSDRNAALRPRTPHGLRVGPRRARTAHPHHQRRPGARPGPLRRRHRRRSRAVAGRRVRRRQPRGRRRHPRRPPT